MVVTYFTFLPGFVFILAGGSLVESTHGKPHYTAPLNGITAAAVGVILNLAAFFAHRVFWPNGLARPADGFAAVVGLSALLALFRSRVGVIAVIGACGFAGLLYTWLTRWPA